MQRPALTRRTLLIAALAPAPAAAAPSWPECPRKPLCRWEQVSSTQDLTTCAPPPRDRAGRVLPRAVPCWQPVVTQWRCAVCGKTDVAVQ